jgi:signal recognition particle receptor subunit beta/predicted  nucleic acid-binding Zn-ribbon protein
VDVDTEGDEKVAWYAGCCIRVRMQLNLRDKLLEAKIAYVGGEASGRRTTFAALAALGGLADDGTSLSLELQPDVSGRFDDCALRVKVVGHQGAPTAETVARLLYDVDGVVVVVDALTSAGVDNLSAVNAVRAAIGERRVPVVVQVNEIDRTGALSAMDVVRGLGADDWPHVGAAASSRTGVEETFNQVVNNVIQSLTESHAHEEDVSPAGRTTGEGHPLLASLRRVLEAQVEGHAARVAEALAARVEERVSARLEQFSERLDALERGHQSSLALVGRAATREDVESVAVGLRDPLSATERYTTAVNERVEVLEMGMEAMRNHLVNCSDELLKSARHAATREDLAASAADLREELVRTIDGGSLAAREAVTASAAVLRRSIESAAADLKKGMPKDGASDLGGRLDDHARKLATSIESSSAPLAALTKLVESDTAVVRDLRDTVGRRLTAIDTAVKGLSEQSGSSGTAVQEGTARVEALLVELIEELRKPKKGWFG